jgi:hypothetical protein
VRCLKEKKGVRAIEQGITKWKRGRGYEGGMMGTGKSYLVILDFGMHMMLIE